MLMTPRFNLIQLSQCSRPLTLFYKQNFHALLQTSLISSILSLSLSLSLSLCFLATKQGVHKDCNWIFILDFYFEFSFLDLIFCVVVIETEWEK